MKALAELVWFGQFLELISPLKVTKIAVWCVSRHRYDSFCQDSDVSRTIFGNFGLVVIGVEWDGNSFFGFFL